MKKKLAIIGLTALSFPVTALASWWNPLTWQTSIQQHIQAIAGVDPNQTKISSLEDTIQTLRKIIADMPKEKSCPVQAPVHQAIVAKAVSVQLATSTALTMQTARITLDLQSNYRISTSLSAINNQYPNLPILAFDIIPSADSQSLTSLTIRVNESGQGSVNVIHLYQNGTNPVATAVISNGVAVFSNLGNVSPLGYPFNPSQYFRVSADISGLDRPGFSESVSASVENATLVDAKGNEITASGSVQGIVMTVTNVPPPVDPQTTQTCGPGYVVGTGMREGCCVNSKYVYDVACGG